MGLTVRAAALALFALGVNCSQALASTITLTFDVEVWDTFDYATQTNNFQPFSTTMSVAFDNTVTLVEQDPNFDGVFFGLPVINSPLTATLPYAPDPAQPPQSRAVLLANRDYGPPNQFSEFTIVENQGRQSGATAWTYTFELDSDGLSLYPLIPNLLQDSSAALEQQLQAYKQNHAALVFDEFAQQYDPQTGQSLSGTAYRTNAYLIDIQETPEPATFSMLGAAFLLFWLKRRGLASAK